MWNKLSKRWGFISIGSVEMADAAAAAKQKKIIEDAKQRAKTMRRNTIFNFGLPSSKSNGPLPQKGVTKSQGPSFAATLPKRNTRTFTQKIKNGLFGKPAPVAAPAPTPVAAAAATTGYERLIADIIKNQEISLYQKFNPMIKLCKELKESIDKLIKEREKLTQKKEEQLQHIHNNDETAERIRNEIKKIQSDISRLFGRLRGQIYNILGPLSGLKSIIQTQNSLPKDYTIFTLRLPIYMKNTDELISYLLKRNEELKNHEMIELLNLQIENVDEATHIKLLNELVEKVNTLNLTDDSDTIRQEMNKAITLFNTNFPFLKNLKEIKTNEKNMDDMIKFLESKGLYYSYSETIKEEIDAIKKEKERVKKELLEAENSEEKIDLFLERRYQNKPMKYEAATIKEHKDRLKKALRENKYSEENINFFLERRGEFNDIEEMVSIDSTKTNDDLNQLLPFIDYSPDDIETIIGRYSLYVNYTLKHVLIMMKLMIRALGLKASINQFKSIFSQNMFTKQLIIDGINKDDIERIYDTFEQEDMDEMNKEIKVRKEINTVRKALDFAKGHEKYLSSNKIDNKAIKIRQELHEGARQRRDEHIVELRNKHEEGFEKEIKIIIETQKILDKQLEDAIQDSKDALALEAEFGNEIKYKVAEEILTEANLWPDTPVKAKAFIEKFKGITKENRLYFILERAQGIIAKDIKNLQYRLGNTNLQLQLNEKLRRLNTRSPEKMAKDKEEIDDAKCLLAPDKRNGLLDESFDDAYKRLLVFLYHKLKQIPIDPPAKYQLKPDEEKELINSIRQFGHEHDLEKMAQDLFHTDLHELSRQIHIFEFNDPTRPPSTDPNKHKRILDKGKQSQRCSLSVAGGFPRAISIIKSHGRKLNYKAAYSTHICEDLSKDCVTVVNNMEIYQSLPSEGKTKSYIVVDPEYFPENSSIPINIIYSHLPIVSFIIDAFLNNAIIEIEDKLEKRMRQDYPELFALSVTTEEAEKMVTNARAKVEKTMKNRESIWFTNRNKSIRQKAVESAIQELDRAKARVEITKARTQIKTNLAIKARNLGYRAAARASIEKNIRNMNQEKTKKALLRRERVEFPGRAPPALNFKDPFVFGPEAPPAAAAPPRPKGPRPSSASTPGLPGGPVASTRKLKPFTIPAPPVRKLPSLADIRLPPKPQWLLNARSRVPGASTPGGPAASTPGLPGGPPRVPNPNNVKKAAADARRALIERNYSNINKNQNKRKALLRSERVKFPGTAPPEPNHLKKAAEVKARAAAGLLPIGLPPKPQWVKNARSGASTHGGPAVVKATFPGLGPGWEEHNNNNWDDGEGPESSKVHEISAVPLVPGAPVIAPGPEAPVASVSGAPAPGLAPPAPALAPLAPEAPAPAPEQPTAVSRNELYESTKKRIGTIRNKFKEAKATINAFKARPKGKAQAKGGRRTRKLKSRR